VSRIASIAGVATATLQKWLETDTELMAAREAGLAEGQRRIQKAQIDCAVEDRNPQMLIWLGKQYLGQREPDKNVNVSANAKEAEQAKAWIEMAKSVAQMEIAKSGGVPRTEFAKPEAKVSE
jgi:hypothetical protein